MVHRLTITSRSDKLSAKSAYVYRKWRWSTPNLKYLFLTRSLQFDFGALRRSEKKLPLRPKGYDPGRRRAYHCFLCHQRIGRHECSVRGSTWKLGCSDPNNLQKTSEDLRPARKYSPTERKSQKEIVRIIVQAGLKHECS